MLYVSGAESTLGALPSNNLSFTYSECPDRVFYFKYRTVESITQ